MYYTTNRNSSSVWTVVIYNVVVETAVGKMCTCCLFIIICLSQIEGWKYYRGTSTHNDTEWHSKDRSLGLDSLRQTTMQIMCKENWLELQLGSCFSWLSRPPWEIVETESMPWSWTVSGRPWHFWGMISESNPYIHLRILVCIHCVQSTLGRIAPAALSISVISISIPLLI